MTQEVLAVADMALEGLDASRKAMRAGSAVAKIADPSEGPRHFQYYPSDFLDMDAQFQDKKTFKVPSPGAILHQRKDFSFYGYDINGNIVDFRKTSHAQKNELLKKLAYYGNGPTLLTFDEHPYMQVGFRATDYGVPTVPIPVRNMKEYESLLRPDRPDLSIMRGAGSFRFWQEKAQQTGVWTGQGAVDIFDHMYDGSGSSRDILDKMKTNLQIQQDLGIDFDALPLIDNFVMRDDTDLQYDSKGVKKSASPAPEINPLLSVDDRIEPSMQELEKWKRAISKVNKLSPEEYRKYQELMSFADDPSLTINDRLTKIKKAQDDMEYMARGIAAYDALREMDTRASHFGLEGLTSDALNLVQRSYVPMDGSERLDFEQIVAGTGANLESYTQNQFENAPALFFHEYVRQRGGRVAHEYDQIRSTYFDQYKGQWEQFEEKFSEDLPIAYAKANPGQIDLTKGKKEDRTFTQLYALTHQESLHNYVKLVGSDSVAHKLRKNKINPPKLSHVQ